MDIKNESFYRPLSTIWEYLRCPCKLKKADCIVGFGNYNCDIGKRAAQLYHEGYSDRILFSGGLGRNTLGLLSVSEAERFAAEALNAGVPERAILIESLSTNSAENIVFTRELLRANGIIPQRLIGVHQPFMERRVKAAFDIVWPEVELLTTSYLIDIPGFFNHALDYGVSERAVIEEVVGDFQRISLYAEKGWQSVQTIPEEAQRAYEELIEMGYTGQLA